MPKRKAGTAVLEEQPGFWIRRLQQIAVAIFLEETQTQGITPVQFSALQAAQRQPGLDQRTLAATIGFDTSTIGGVIDRLERGGLIERQACASDRRVRLLKVTAAGEALLDAVIPGMLRAQQRIVAPLPMTQRQQFLPMLRTVVEANNGLTRAPSEA
jgi:MarR family transcriptional regulator, lower aerobic nicotinate degradation pathway regulator